MKNATPVMIDGVIGVRVDPGSDLLLFDCSNSVPMTTATSAFLRVTISVCPTLAVRECW